MKMSGDRGGQRGNTTAAGGKKSRSPTSNSHRGSRVEPSHITDSARKARAKQAAGGKPAKTARKKA
jgi:hypothetical protein